MTISRWVLGLLAFLGVVTLVAFAIAIQGVRIGQQATDRKVTEVTRIVSMSPCANLTRAACFHRLIQAAAPSDIEAVRGQ
jgi:hypothetical protein